MTTRATGTFDVKMTPVEDKFLDEGMGRMTGDKQIHGDLEGIGKGEGGGTAASAAQLGAGLAMGQQMAQALGAPQTGPGGAPQVSGSNPSAGMPELLSPADAAKALGVSENDVMTALADGSLKGKKIGATWRITRSALDDFLKS